MGDVVVGDVTEQLVDTPPALFESPRKKANPAGYSPTRAQAICITCSAVIVLLSLVATGAFTVGNYYAAQKCGTTTAIAETVIFSNTSVDPCVEPVYDLACGGYENLHHKYSNLGDFQMLLYSKAKLQMTVEPFVSTLTGKFHADCLAYAAEITKNASMYEYLEVNAIWMWQRGFSAFGITFGRTVNPANPTESIVYIVNDTFFTVYHDTVLPTVLRIDAGGCDATIVDLARSVVENSLLNNIAVYSSDLASLCDLAEQWRSSISNFQDNVFTIQNLFETSDDCLRTTALLWPGMVNNIIDDVGNKGAATAMTLCHEIQEAYVAMLTDNGYTALAAKIRSVTCSTHTVNTFSVYDVGDYTNLTFVDYASLLLWQRFKQSVASASVSSGGAFSMSSLEVNAVYSPLSNQLLITPAMLLFSASMSDRRAFALGRIGFVLAHELSHAIDNKGIFFDANGQYTHSSLIPVAMQREVNASFDCLADQFDNNKLTLQEDIADHLAMVVVNDMMEKSPAEDDLHLCAPVCKTYTSMQQFYIHFAQTWCSSSSYNLLSAASHDVHSSPRQRVNNTLDHVRALDAFQCNLPKQSSPCFIYSM